MSSALSFLRIARRVLTAILFLFPVGCWSLAPCGFVDGAMAAVSSLGASAPQKVWRVAYIEGGPFVDYQKVLRGVALGLQRMGLIRNGAVPLPENSESVSGMWEWLAHNAGGTKVRFLTDAFYSADWDAETRAANREALLKRIREKNDIDLVLAFGTWGGQDLADADVDVPVIVASVTNAVEAGIIPSAEDSGRDNLAAPIEPDRFKHQVMLFHDIFKFKKLGIAYEDTPSGRGSIALSEIESAAQELGVELLRCNDTFDVEDPALAADRLKACHARLAKQGADAVYLTYNRGMQPDTIADVLAPLAKAHVPTFSQTGESDVAHGALLSISQANTEEEGVFNAELMDAIIRGAKPRDLSQIFESSVSLAMNLRMATLIGWNPPLEILAAVDEFYQEMR